MFGFICYLPYTYAQVRFVFVFCMNIPLFLWIFPSIFYCFRCWEDQWEVLVYLFNLYLIYFTVIYLISKYLIASPKYHWIKLIFWFNEIGFEHEFFRFKIVSRNIKMTIDCYNIWLDKNDFLKNIFNITTP